MENNLLLHINTYFEEKAHHNNGDGVDVDEVLSVYSFLTHDKPKLLEVALEVLDKQENHRIVQVISQSTGRSFHLIQGSQNRKYLILSNFCPCQSFSQLFNKAATKSHAAMKITDAPLSALCKHMFAVSLATSLSRIDKQVVSDAQFMEIFRSVEVEHN
jgi:predicted nucleic acid-binding Zn finger protein